MGRSDIVAEIDAALPAALPAALEVDPTLLVGSFPGPAALVDLDGHTLAANPQADELVEALANGNPVELGKALAEAIRHWLPVAESLRLQPSGMSLDVTILPLGTGIEHRRGLLVLGRNVTLETNLRNALVESRQRYKDLVDCSTDFAWETGGDGCFIFVSPKGGLGYDASELIGRHPRALLVDSPETTTPLAFESAHAVDHGLAWMRTADGRSACLQIASVPLFAGDGSWNGARGVCRDVTIAREQEAALARVHRRERALAGVIRAMRVELDPHAVLEAAARAMAHGVNATGCWIYRRDSAGNVHCDASHPPEAQLPEQLARRIEPMVRNDAARSSEVVETDTALLISIQHGQAVNGAVAVLRAGAVEPWTSDDRSLLAGVANQLGITIEQARIHDDLQRLSRTDGLTGLLNRRAFIDEVNRRRGHAMRHLRPAALIYADANNFKAINDRFGHRRGDQAIKALAELIAGSHRAGDIAARVGGDEFVLWLDETDLAGARAKAAAIVRAAVVLEQWSAAPDQPLGVAIGVAEFDPKSGESLDSLLERADLAQYEAKRHRDRSYFVVAPPVGGVGSQA